MTYEFKVGDTGKTRGGDEYSVLAAGIQNALPIIALITYQSGSQKAMDFHQGGRYYDQRSSHEHDNDLIPPTQAVYFNVYENDGRFELGGPRNSREEADIAISSVWSRVGCLRMEIEARFDD